MLEELLQGKSTRTKNKRPTVTNPKKLIKWQQETYIWIITLNVNRLNAPNKRHKLAKWIQK